MLKRIRSRSRVEWLLAAHAMVAMTLVVVGVRGLPCSIWRRVVTAGDRERRGAGPIVVSAPKIVRAVETASRVVPGGTNCLARALTTRMLMARYGLGSTLRLGVA